MSVASTFYAAKSVNQNTIIINNLNPIKMDKNKELRLLKLLESTFKEHNNYNSSLCYCLYKMRDRNLITVEDSLHMKTVVLNKFKCTSSLWFKLDRNGYNSRLLVLKALKQLYTLNFNRFSGGVFAIIFSTCILIYIMTLVTILIFQK